MLAFNDRVADELEGATDEAAALAAIAAAAAAGADGLRAERPVLVAPLGDRVVDGVRDVYVPHLDSWIDYLAALEQGPGLLFTRDDQQPYLLRINATAAAFADACNEFWWVAPYVAKGLLRGELTYACHHLDTVMRAQLMTMLDWGVAGASGSRRGAGKHGRHLRRELAPERWRWLEATFAAAGEAAAWDALEAFLANVVLGGHLERLPADRHADFVRAVADGMERPVIDYVRIEALAVRR
jgi:hypothetical protein